MSQLTIPRRLHNYLHMKNLLKPLDIFHLVFVYPAIEVLNFPPGGRGKREQPIKSFRSTAKYAVCYFHHLLIAAFKCVLGTFLILTCSLYFADERRQHYVWCWSAEKQSSERRWSSATASPLYCMRSESIWSMWVKQVFLFSLFISGRSIN